MPIEVTNLDSLDAVDVQSREDVLIELISEKFPTLDLTKGGILEQFLAYPSAILDVLTQEELDRLRRSRSLTEIAADPELADDELVDAILSNYLVTRVPGATANGTVAVVVSTLTTIVVPAATEFTVDSRTFRPTQAVIAVTSQANATSANNVVLQRDSEGNYWFPVYVEEDVTGGSAILAGTDIALSSEPAGFIRAYAASDFEAGSVTESNTDLMNNLAQGISAKAVADRVSIRGLLQAQFPYIVDMNIIGHGDAEMTRDSHNIFAISSGGKADVYVRTRQNPTQSEFVVMAYPISVTGATARETIYGTELTIDPTLAPGFYNVESIARYGDPVGSGAFFYDLSFSEPVARGIYTVDGTSMPYIGDASEAAYSKYQGNALLHIDDSYGQKEYIDRYTNMLSSLIPFTVYDNGFYRTIATIEHFDNYVRQGVRFYSVSMSKMPDITPIQDFLNSYDRQAPASSDYLVKATFPCTTTVNASIAYKKGTTPPDANVMRAAIVDAINSTKLDATELPATTITDAIKDVMGADGYGIVPISMVGNIRLPDGTMYNITSSDSLIIPALPAYPSISKRTVSFITYPPYVTISYREVNI